MVGEPQDMYLYKQLQGGTAVSLGQSQLVLSRTVTLTVWRGMFIDVYFRE